MFDRGILSTRRALVQDEGVDLRAHPTRKLKVKKTHVEASKTAPTSHPMGPPPDNVKSDAQPPKVIMRAPT